MSTENNDLKSPISDQPRLRQARTKYSGNFIPILNQLKISLVFSTYQAGQLGVITVKNNQLKLSFHNFDKAMGIAMSSTQLAVGGRDWIYLLKNNPNLASRIEPPDSYDACFLTREAQYTGNIQIHDLAWGNQKLWGVNTRFSCLCTFDKDHNFLSQWQPSFISTLSPEDRCHLNGMAMVNGMPKYVTVMSQTDNADGWRKEKATSGCVLEVPSSKVVISGLSMPHSPRFHEGFLWVLNSGKGELIASDPASGVQETIVTLPGYTRGLALFYQYAFVGLSKIRETAIFGDLPIFNQCEQLECGIAIVNLPKRQVVGFFEFTEGIEEIYDVQISQFSAATISGPNTVKDGNDEIWSLPQT